MKNQNLKTNKTKLIAKLMLVVIWCVCVLNLSACGRTQKYMYVAKHNLYGNRYVIQSSLWTDNDEYYNSDVEFELSLAIHKLNILGEIDENPKEQLPSVYQDGTLKLNVILCNSLDDGSFNEKIIKTISDEELFSKKYGYIDTPFFINNGVTYMNSEKIIIPKEYFTLDYGSILIKLELVHNRKSGEVCSPITYTYTINYLNVNGCIKLDGGLFIYLYS